MTYLKSQLLSAWYDELVDQYARKKGSSHLQPSLFEHDAQPHLTGLGPGRWITIGAEDHHGHHVYLGSDGKMKTGAHSGQSMDEAFGKGKKAVASQPGEDRGEPIKQDELLKAARAKDEEEAKRKLDQKKQLEEPEDDDKPEDDELKPIPFRDRKAFADEMAQNGKTQSEITEAMMSRGVAGVDARRHASDAMDRLGDKPEAVDNRSDQQKSIDEFTENASTVAGDPEGSKSRDLHRASNFLEGQINSLNRKVQRGDITKEQHRERKDAIEREQDWYKSILKGRGDYTGPPYSDEKGVIDPPKPKPGIIEPSKPTNDEAKPGDQLGLFGEADRAKKPGWKPSLLGGDSKGKQSALFDTKGDPDQMMMFDDGVTPEDRLLKNQDGPKDIMKMSPEELKAHIDSQPIGKFATSRVEDWGSLPRGAGKRLGNGMIMGSMSGAVTGKKTYTNLLGKLPEDEMKAANLLDTHEQAEYAKARAAGLNHDNAMDWAWEATGDKDFPSGFTHEQLHADAAEREKKSSDKPKVDFRQPMPTDAFTKRWITDNHNIIDRTDTGGGYEATSKDGSVWATGDSKKRLFAQLEMRNFGKIQSAYAETSHGKMKAKKLGATPSEAAETAHDEAIAAGKSPRQAVEVAQKERDADYEFARQSEVGNAGEDLKGSARHRVNEWKGLAQAEKDGTAAEMMTRKSLLRVEPHNLMASISDTHAMSHLIAHSAISAFPESPGDYPAAYDKYTDRQGNPLPPKSTPEQLRKQYHTAYMAIKGTAEKLATTEADPRVVSKGIAEEVKKQINIARGLPANAAGMQTLDAKDPYNPVANSLVNLANRAGGSGRRKTDFMGRAMEVAKLSREKYGDNPTREHLGHIKQHVLDLMEGKSLNKTFGKESKAVKRFDPSAAYVKHASRTGGRDLSAVTADANKATKHMVESMGLRGVQWGNSVTDDERKHHAGKAVEALTDLADVTGLHPKDIALDGKLGLAIGARGKGNASAHYEPATQVVNLTRASGVGALAHEWGHAFDHMLSGFGLVRGEGNYMSRRYDYKKEDGKNPIREAYGKWWNDSQKYRTRLREYLGQAVRDGEMTHKKANDYWNAGHEIFARTFERHVQHKLESDGKQNTYLAGLGGDHPLWPTKEEAASMAESMDGILTAYRQHKHGSADKVKFSQREVRSAMRSLLGSVEVDRYKATAEGKRWITIGAEPGEDGKKHGGHPVLINTKDGEIESGKFKGKTLDTAFGKKSKPSSPKRKEKPASKPEVKQEAKQADPEAKPEPKEQPEKSIEQKLLGKRAGSAKVVGALIQESIKKDGHASLIGHTVSSAEDLASLAQVYRNSSYETFRAFLVKDGKVVAHNAYSSRAPGLVMIPQHVRDHLIDDMKATGADGYYLMHNHPSGDPTPSREDIVTTQAFAQHVPGMIDHVIINHTKGAVINASGESRGYSLQNEDLNSPSRAKGEVDYLGHVITSPQALGMLAKRVEPKNKGRAVMIFCNVKLKSRMIIDLDSNELKDRGNKNYQIAGAIRRASRQTAATERFLVLGDGEKFEDYKHLIENGLVLDIVAPSSGESAMDKGFRRKRTRLEENLRGGVVAREKYASYIPFLMTNLDAIVDRYAGKSQLAFDWDEASHPREQAGADGGKGGQFAKKKNSGSGATDAVNSKLLELDRKQLRQVKDSLDKLQRNHSEWKAKDYKQNNSKIDRLDDSGEPSGMQTISDVNERRRRKALNTIKSQIDDHEKLAQALENRIDKTEALSRPAKSIDVPSEDEMKKAGDDYIAMIIGGDGEKAKKPKPVKSPLSRYPEKIKINNRMVDRPPIYLSGKNSDAVKDAAKTQRNIGLMVTPATSHYANHVGDYEFYGVDNGCYSGKGNFDEKKFYELLDRLRVDGHADKALFAVAPDVFDPSTGKGDWEETLERSRDHLPRIRKAGFPAAIVLQDGATADTVPWDDVDVLFVGGSTEFKTATNKDGTVNRDFVDIIREAKQKKIPVHFGRVNSDQRLELTHFGLNAASMDGTFLAFGPDKNLPKLKAWLKPWGEFPKRDKYAMRLGHSILSAWTDRYERQWDESKHIRDNAGRFSETGDTFSTKAYGKKDSMPITIKSMEKGMAKISNGFMTASVPTDSLEQLRSDTTGDYSYMKVFGESKSPEVNAVINGQAKFIGKGADGVVHDVGNGMVVKSSTTVPYHTVGGGDHYTPNEAVEAFAAKINLEREMHAAGIPGVMKTRSGMHGDKIFSVRPKLDVEKPLNDQQLEQVKASIQAMHAAGYSLNDEIQVGIGEDGNVYHFDLGQADKGATKDQQKDDWGHFARFVDENKSKQKEEGKYSNNYRPILTDRYALSDASREAGNYKMKHIRMHGLAISIETQKGQRRNPAWPPMPCDYGYIKGTMGRDGDHVDVFIGPDRDSELVVVVDQVCEKGGFDEHKCILGYATTDQAIAAYKSAYTKGWKVGPVTTMTISQFKSWLELGSQSKQISKQVSKYWNRSSDDDLRLDESPTVDRYEWNAAEHPRMPAGSPQGGEFAGKNRPGGSISQRFIDSGTSPNATRWLSDNQGRSSGTGDISSRIAKSMEAAFANQQTGQPAPAMPKSSKKREIADRPDTIRPGHPLHMWALDKGMQAKLTDWSTRLRNELEPMQVMPSTVSKLSPDEQIERGWAEVDKGKVRELLAEMNQLNRDAEGSGIKLHEFVNANGLIPKSLAERLDGGSRFFDPEKLGNRLRSTEKASPDAKLLNVHPEQTFPTEFMKSAFDDEQQQQIHDFLGAKRPNREAMLQNDSIRNAIETALGLRKPTPRAAPPQAPEAPEAKQEAAKPSAPAAPEDHGLTTPARNKLNSIASELVGSGDPEKKNHFIKIASEAWKQIKASADEHNDALRQLTSFFGKHHGALAANIAKGVDPTKLKGFDELVDHAQREYPHLISHVASESESGSAEEGLVKALREGVRPIPQPWHDEVIDQAMKMVGPGFFDDFTPEESDQEEEPIPFSVRSDLQRAVERYWKGRTAYQPLLLAAV